jgi:hypothetical protein
VSARVNFMPMVSGPFSRLQARFAGDRATGPLLRERNLLITITIFWIIVGGVSWLLDYALSLDDPEERMTLGRAAARWVYAALWWAATLVGIWLADTFTVRGWRQYPRMLLHAVAGAVIAFLWAVSAYYINLAIIPGWRPEGATKMLKTTAPPELQNLPHVRKLVMLPRGTPDEPGPFEQMLSEMLRNPAIHELISRRAAALTQKAEAERSGVISAAQSHTHFLDSPRIRRVLARTTFDLGKLKTGRMTVYVVVPARRLPRYNRLLRLVIGSAFTRISSIPGRPEHRTLVLLDEFTQLKRLGPVEEAFRLHRGYGVWFWLFVQDLAAFEEVYPKTWRSFLANAGVLQAFGTNDWYTAEELSKRAGETTVFVESENRSRGISRGKMDNVQEGAGQSTSEKGRRLIFAHEILTLDPEEELQLLFVQGNDPILSRRVVYYKDTAYQGQHDPNPQHEEVAA